MTYFCVICHKPITVPTGVSIGGTMTIKCPDGHENIFEGGKNVTTEKNRTPNKADKIAEMAAKREAINKRNADLKAKMAAEGKAQQKKMLQNQITMQTKMRDNVQSRVDTMTAKIKELQDKLDAIK